MHIRSLKPYWILKFLHVCAYVFARICTYLRTYLQVYASMCNYTYIDTPNNFLYKKYVHIRAIRANTCKYGTTYVQHTCIYVLHFCANTCKYGRSYVHVYASICKYMHVCCTYTYVYVCKMYVYASMGKYVHVCHNFFCQYVLGSRTLILTQKGFLLFFSFQLPTTGSRQAKSWPRS